jgi:DNA processing protein
VDARKYWLGFSLVPEIGPKRLAQLLHHFGDLSAAWSASEADLRAAGLSAKPTANLLRVRAALNLDAELEKVARCNARIVTLADIDYPPLLKEIEDAPTVLYVRGTLLPEDSRAIAVVGTRKATTYGRDAAHDLAYEMARQGVLVISGLAHGVDAAAHRGALKAGGRTLAVFGCGIDRVYPGENRALAYEIIDSGAALSELPLGTRPRSANFPRRNRIMSGMALGVLVIEAPEKSGAHITVTTALEQGREVFAVPGSIFNPMSRGTNRLIQEGAKLVARVEDILNELHLRAQPIKHKKAQVQQQSEQIDDLTEPEALLMKQISAEPIHIDELIRQSGMSSALVSSTLTILELKLLIREIGGMQYIRAR